MFEPLSPSFFGVVFGVNMQGCELVTIMLKLFKNINNIVA